MTSDVHIRAATLPRELPIIKELCWEYRETLIALGDEVRRAVDTLYDTGTWADLMNSLPKKHARPKGAILIAEIDSVAVGCGMIQPLNDNDAEIKRVYVKPSIQGRGLGKTLTLALIEQARADGYQRILLDTTKASTAARKLYEKLGFIERGPYSEVPEVVLDLLVFYEFSLQTAAADKAG